MTKSKAQELLQKCIVRINTTSSIGTGFFVDDKTIVTCHHVIKAHSAQEIEINWENKKLEITHIYSNHSSDLSIITVNISNNPSVQIDEAINLGDLCYSYGFPPTYRDTGDPLSFKYEGKNDSFLKFKDGQFQPGFSGAPILNLSTKKVCGIIKKTRDEDSDLGGRGIPIFNLYYLKQLNNLKDKKDLKIKIIKYKKRIKLLTILALLFATFLTIFKSTLWAIKENLPFGYALIEPLWLTGIYEPFPEMIKIKPKPDGFTMGCAPERDGNQDQSECDEDEIPSHNESIEQEFWIGKNEVTFLEYDYYIWSQQREGGKINFPHANYGGRYNQPIININWYEANNYTKWLSQKLKKKINLPSEKQWEYSARANSSNKYYWGNKLPSNYANCKTCNNNVHSTMPVGSFEANAWKLHDMAGNVWEWTNDEYLSKNNEMKDIFGDIDQVQNLKVIKGGSFLRSIKFIRPSEREAFGAINNSIDLGFRVVSN